MYYRINYDSSTKIVRLESGSGSAPAAIGGGWSSLGTFRHDNDADVSSVIAGMQLLADNHALFHHVQEALYKQAGVQDMSSVTIWLDGTRAISISTGTVTVAAGANSAALAVTATPAAAADKDVTFTSSDVTKATVNAAGVIHGVAAGSAVITAKLKSNDTITATRAVTVTA